MFWSRCTTPRIRPPQKRRSPLIEKDGGRAFAIKAPLGVPGDVDELFLGLERGLRERTGATTLDILVNNAAEISPSGIAPEDVTPEQFDRSFAVNAKAPFFIVQRALPLLPEGGRIVNISSTPPAAPSSADSPSMALAIRT